VRGGRRVETSAHPQFRAIHPAIRVHPLPNFASRARSRAPKSSFSACLLLALLPFYHPAFPVERAVEIAGHWGKRPYPTLLRWSASIQEPNVPERGEFGDDTGARSTRVRGKCDASTGWRTPHWHREDMDGALTARTRSARRNQSPERCTW
jgi:hypothetical protein